MSLPRHGDVITAGCDIGLRSDSSALVIVHTRNSVRYVAEVLELRPRKGTPLKPSEVCNEFAAMMKTHRASHVLADQHYRETVDEFLSAAGLVYVPAPNRPAEAYVRTRVLLRQGLVRLPDHPRLLQQMREVTARTLAGGGLSIIHSRTGGGHGDICAAAVLAIYATGGNEIPFADTQSWEEKEREKRRKACREAQPVEGTPWWKSRGSRPGPRR